MQTLIRQRIYITGNSCSGKSTLAEVIAKLLNVALVDLDELNWLPNWYGLNQHEPKHFEEKIDDATRGDGWIVAGSYLEHCQRTFWPRLQTVIWLDLPLHLLIPRMLLRSWRRWRNQELLWGTNREKFWPQIAIWRKDRSLLWWLVSQHKSKRLRMESLIRDPKWAHVHFIRLRSNREIKDFLAKLNYNISPAGGLWDSERKERACKISAWKLKATRSMFGSRQL